MAIEEGLEYDRYINGGQGLGWEGLQLEPPHEDDLLALAYTSGVSTGMGVPWESVGKDLSGESMADGQNPGGQTTAKPKVRLFFTNSFLLSLGCDPMRGLLLICDVAGI